MSSDNELDAMTDEQAAEHYYRHRDVECPRAAGGGLRRSRALIGTR